MLKTKPLDDRLYKQILESAMNRLPALCPEWTDYNAHDPGVTLLELFAWYEEMQRFHLDQMTEEIRRKLLALLGVTPASSQPARCRIHMTGVTGLWPEGALFSTEENIPFELEESITVGTTALTGVHLCNDGHSIDVTDLLNREGAAIQPFLHGGEPTDMLLDFSRVDTSKLRLWFDVCEAEVCPRNPFADDTQMPRIIRWFWNDREIFPISDDTHALSVSGFVTLPVTECEQGTLRLILKDPGCEETVRINTVQCHIACAVQQRTWARCFTDTVAAEKETVEELCFAHAIDGTITGFLRTEKGWEQIQSGMLVDTAVGKHITLNTEDAVQDGHENLLLICTTAARLNDTFFSSNGLPNQKFPLPLNGERPVGELLLIGDALAPDGTVRPTLWRCVDDLSTCGPGDTVFTFDARRESLIFGDGRHGAIVPAGEGSLLIASMQTSLCGKGNIPGGEVLRFWEEEHRFTCSPGVGGAEAETAEDACIRFMKKFPDTHKCVTAEDYARIARETPGLRVAMAKALPGFDPREPAGSTVRPVVNVVVVPYGADVRPTPDERFLLAVKQHLEKYRPICVQVFVSPPRYLTLDFQLRVRADKTTTEEQLRLALNAWLSEREIGQTLIKNELALFIQKQPGVWKIDRLEIASFGGCVRNSMGDVVLPKDGIAVAGKIQIEIL